MALLVEEDDFAVDTSTNKQFVSPDDPNRYQRLSGTGLAHRMSGTIGSITWSGFPEDDEINPKLARFVKYNTYYNAINDTPVLGACVQTFLETIGSSRFNLIQSKHDKDGMVKDFFDEMFFRDCRTPFRKIVQHLAMAKLYGFAMMTWNWRKREMDGRLTLDQLRVLPQHTIYQYLPDHEEVPRMIRQWDRRGFHNTRTGQFEDIPYWKIVHIVEDVVRNTREGDGLLRRVIEECFAYHAHKAIQKFGFERALRGVMKFRAPREPLELAIRTELTASGKYEDPDALARAVKDRINNVELKYEQELADAVRKNKLHAHVRLDSSVVVHRDDKGGDRPVATPKYDVEFMDTKSDPQAHEVIQKEIGDIEFRIAEVFGLEATQLGKGGSSGTYNLSVDKTDNFRLRLESTLDMIADGLYSGIIVPFGMANGIDEMKLPKFNTEIIKPKDTERSMKILVEMEKVGFNKADPAYAQIRADEGLPNLTPEQMEHAKKMQEAKFKAELEMPDAELEQAKQAGKPKEPMANAKERGDPPNKNKPQNAREPNKR